MIPDQNMALNTPVISANGSAPRCDHLDGLTPVTAQSTYCRDCRADGDERPMPLLLCLTCGWVACSDTSRKRHARAHYEETDHPVAAGVEPGARGRWCYVHQRPV
ncbi:UBP-type zinc finger domain-containing protein [Actinomadura scrupuli]|uniref:UBP-type zinc finger domain-containing protein n=1 Tax=Actinomadura scrupuli TaxID=559629 RepID=UPI003D9596DB